MPLRPARAACVLLMLLSPLASASPAWQPVPGAAELEIDLGSLEAAPPRAQAWLRWWGRSPLAPELGQQAARPPRLQRTAVLTEFDCARRLLRPLAAQGWGAGGRMLALSSLAGAARPVPEGDLAWAHDAVCEAARAGAGR